MRTGNDKRDDGELVRWARGGDRDAFTALVGRCRDMVYGAAFCFLGSAEDAEVRAATRIKRGRAAFGWSFMLLSTRKRRQKFRSPVSGWLPEVGA